MSEAGQKLQVLPKREWSTSEQVVDLLEDLLKQAKTGELVSIAYVCETAGDDYVCGSTKVKNAYAMIGYLMGMQHRLIHQNEVDNS